MSDDIFKRSDTGFESSELHKHGGPSAPEEDRTEREDLEDAIEALNDSEETENLEEIEKDIISEGEDIEPIEDEKPIEVKSNVGAVVDTISEPAIVRVLLVGFQV